MRERRFSNPWDILEKEMPTSQKRDNAHFDHLRFTFDHPRNIVLNGLNDSRWIHDGLGRELALEDWLVIGHDRSLTKGLETVNLFKIFAPLRSGIMARGLDQSLTQEPV